MNEEPEMNEIFDDILTYFDCPSWQEFCSSLTNDQKKSKSSNYLISSIIQRISKGDLNPSLIFIKNDVSELVDSFISNPDRRFFNIASHLLKSIKNCASLPFFELLLQRSPQTMISLIDTKDINLFTQYVRILTRSYISKENRYISDALCKYKPTLVLRELFLTISNLKMNVSKYSYNYDALNEDSENDFDTTSTVSLLFELWKINNKKNNLSNFYSYLKNESTVSFEFHSDNVINSILDFLQFGLEHQLFEYSIVFNEIFGKTSNQYFVAILLERMKKTDETVVQIQIELIDRDAGRPLREELRKSGSSQKKNLNSTNSLLTSFSDKDLISLSNQFSTKGSIPEKIVHLYMFDKTVLIEKVASDLRRLSQNNNCCKLLVDALEKKKMIPPIKEQQKYETVIETLRDTDSTMAQFPEVMAKVKAVDYSPKFFDAFSKALYLRHSDNVKIFCEKVAETVIYRLNDLKGFTECVVNYLTSCLFEQHRKSLALIAVRCPLHDFIESNFFNQKREKEIQLLNDLHEAAILSCSFLTSKIESKLNEKAVYFDPLLILRLRWRNFRGDCSCPISWFPEFVSLFDNDCIKFLMWELNEEKPEKIERRSQILAKLGITTNFEKIPLILRHLLMFENPKKTVVDALIPVLMNCPIEKVSLPEKVNISILFRISSILWSKSVMNHPDVLKILREKPPLEISQSLLMCCNSNSFNFVCFPIGFYALVCNSNELIGEKPEILISVTNSINEIMKGENIDLPFEFPKYAKISMICYLIKRGVRLGHFFNNDIEFDSICIFFFICFKKFDAAVELLGVNENVMPFLLLNFTDGTSFVGPNVWITSLIEFAFYCAANGIRFESKKWAQFISMVYNADWPKIITDDQSNFALIRDYMADLEID